MTLMDQAFSMFDVMALISIVVGSLGIINTLTMSVIERTREIGMLRAIGTTRGQITQDGACRGGLDGRDWRDYWGLEQVLFWPESCSLE